MEDIFELGFDKNQGDSDDEDAPLIRRAEAKAEPQATCARRAGIACLILLGWAVGITATWLVAGATQRALTRAAET